MKFEGGKKSLVSARDKINSLTTNVSVMAMPSNKRSYF
jgi:hypothetical protein